MVKTIVGEDLSRIPDWIMEAATFFASQLRALMLRLHPSRPGCSNALDWGVATC